MIYALSSVLAACLLLVGPSSLARENTLSDEETEALQRALAWIRDSSGGRTPAPKDFKAPDFPFTYDKLVGKRRYGPKNEYRFAIFRSDEGFWLELKRLGRAQHTKVSLLGVNFKNPSRQILKWQRDEAFELILQWVKAHGKLPRKRDFGLKAGQIPVCYERLVARHQYAPGQLSQGMAFSENVEEHWIAFKHYADQHHCPVRLLDLVLEDPPSPRLQAMRRAEASRLVLEWIEQNQGALPKTTDFGSQPGQIPIRYASLSGGDKSSFALYTKPEQFWRRLKRDAALVGQPIRLWEVTFTRSLEPETRALLREEAHELILSWTQRHVGQTPKSSDFGSGAGQIPISYFQLMGVGEYRPEGPLGELAIFNGRKEFHHHHQAYARSRGIELKTDEGWSKPCKRIKEARKPIKHSIFDLTLDWMMDPDRGHCRFPEREDFGEQPYQLNLDYDQLFAGRSDLPAQRGRFVSLQSFYRELHAYARTQGVALRLLDAPLGERLDERTRSILKKEALDLIVGWMFHSGNGEPPRWFHFKGQEGTLPIDFFRLIGAGDYGPQGRLYGMRLMDSLNEYRHSLDQHLAQRETACMKMLEVLEE